MKMYGIAVFILGVKVLCINGLTVTKSEGVLSSLDEPATLECQVDNLVEFCSFIRPDKLEVCQNGPNNDLVGKSCINDDSVQVLTGGSSCKLNITRTKEHHFGKWGCKAMFWDEWAESTLDLGTFKMGELELKDVWGTLKLETDIQQTLSCLLTLDDPLESGFEGTILNWELGDIEDRIQLTEAVLEMRNGRTEFESTLQLTPTQADDGKMLYCSSGVTGKDDYVTLDLFKFSFPNSESMRIVEGGAATSTIQFQAYPRIQSDQVKLEVRENNGIMVNTIPAGQTAGGVSVDYVENLGGRNMHSVDVTINNITQKASNYKYTIIYSTDAQEYRTELDIVLLPRVQLPDEVVTDKPNFFTTTTIVVSDSLVSKESMSLYIIIGIIVVFSILCIAYYSFKCCCKEEEAKNDPELAPMVVIAETGQPGVNSPLLKDGPEKDQVVNGLDTVDFEDLNTATKLKSFNETELKKSELGDQTLAAPADNPPSIMENKKLLGADQEVKAPAAPTPAVQARELEALLDPTINQDLEKTAIEEKISTLQNLTKKTSKENEENKESWDENLNVEEDLNKLLKSINFGGDENNNQDEANQEIPEHSPAEDDLEVKSPLEVSQVEIPLQSPTSTPEHQFQEFVLTMRPTLKLSQLKTEQNQFETLSSPSLVLNSVPAPKPALTENGESERLGLKPPKGPRGMNLVSAQVQTDSMIRKQKSVTLSRSNSMDAGTQTPKLSSR
ncbi:uncharacterized protein LOC111701141 isoform X2 [Eurytemora carolleeae]|uniref:uncharacterized protein LOC111701141 isoform X2 n=1 Tax=Eurytemora carolleeae TaxID=1294199 RepID=UPI000C76CBDD|nr:uncharacterized protein LOC111701141 isoform X2 [Eurytemora carolleeae]|eukprot:XP_023328074.1 uncharacterized protein LOC111701141 isoform X2 [Eurytemora affinis]